MFIVPQILLLKSTLFQLALIMTYHSSEKFYDQTALAKIVRIGSSFKMGDVTSLKLSNV